MTYRCYFKKSDCNLQIIIINSPSLHHFYHDVISTNMLKSNDLKMLHHFFVKCSMCKFREESEFLSVILRILYGNTFIRLNATDKNMTHTRQAILSRMRNKRLRLIASRFDENEIKYVPRENAARPGLLTAQISHDGGNLCVSPARHAVHYTYS